MPSHRIAKKEGVGVVVLCRNRETVHVSLGQSRLSLSKEDLPAVSSLLQEAIRHPLICRFQPNPPMFMAEQLFSRA